MVNCIPIQIQPLCSGEAFLLGLPYRGICVIFTFYIMLIEFFKYFCYAVHSQTRHVLSGILTHLITIRREKTSEIVTTRRKP